MKNISALIVGLILWISSNPINAQTTITLDSTTLTEREVAIGIQVPWEILWGPDVEGECNTTAEMGFCDANNVREPLAEWTPCVAVNGIEYYSHPSIPEWQNTMLMAVLGGFALLPRLSVLYFNADGTVVEEEVQYFANYGRIRDVCINPHNGAIFFCYQWPFLPW